MDDEEYVQEVKAAIEKAWADATEYTRARGFTWGDIATAMGHEVDTDSPEVYDLSRVLHTLAEQRYLRIDRSTQPHRFKPRKKASNSDT